MSVIHAYMPESRWSDCKVENWSTDSQNTRNSPVWEKPQRPQPLLLMCFIMSLRQSVQLVSLGKVVPCTAFATTVCSAVERAYVARISLDSRAKRVLPTHVLTVWRFVLRMNLSTILTDRCRLILTVQLSKLILWCSLCVLLKLIFIILYMELYDSLNKYTSNFCVYLAVVSNRQGLLPYIP